ncbi:PH domain-containing protein [uncultured Arthrobacter sp.]|uniref:PH domain-containing protein n=1 Tax=uncultured Arthrobacter sp. TaxID=114050 RepID=UPI0025E1B5CD|nr:PH domain-containing protein [uncultured Arthrobacter sp.]
MKVKLAPGEQVLTRTRATPRSLIWPSIGALAVLTAGGYALGWLSRAAVPPELQQWQPLLVTVAAVGGALLLLRMFLRPLLRWLAGRYILTNQRLIHRRGMTRRSLYEVPLAAVHQVGVTQSLVQRPFGSGTLTLDLGFGRSVSYRDVPCAAVFRDHVAEAIGQLPQSALFNGRAMMGQPGPDQWPDQWPDQGQPAHPEARQDGPGGAWRGAV